MSVSLLIEAAGAMTTVQDLGRTGAQSLGVSPAGALDPVSLRLANALVGNDQGTAGLECRFIGPKMRVIGGPARLALVGTNASLEIGGRNPRIVPSGHTVTVAEDDTVKLGTIYDTSCCYIAISGGVDVPAVLDSRSTYLPSAIGGFHGRALRDGDQINLFDLPQERVRERRLGRRPTENANKPIRVVPGPQDDYFTKDAIKTFLTQTYRVSSGSNRMGLRLEGPPLRHEKGFNIPSDGIVTGSIQVPGNGLPIVLLTDRQTTGGYPKVATVISADLARLARRRPGETLRFEAVSVDVAETLRHALELEITSAITSCEYVPDSAALIAERLMKENLISGVVGD